MNRDRYTRAKDLFLRVCERPTAERADFLERECDDPALREEVRSLLHFQLDDLDDPPSPEPLRRRFHAGDLFADRYRIVALLGVGGMGEVYRADDLRLDVQVAIKFLRSASEPELQALLNEVRLAREVTHPAVCRVYDVGERDGETYLTMEYVAGENLAALLRRVGRLPSERVRSIGAEICAGLAAAHARGVLHRDLKPANVLVDEAGRVRLSDFGIAIRTADVPTDAAGPRGTPTYMAPEQFAGGDEVGEATDLYALGVLLYELVTGRPVFEAERFAELLALHREGAPRPPSEWVPELDPALETAILQCLAKRGEQRPASASALGDALRPAEDSAPSRERPTPPTRSERRQVTVLAIGWPSDPSVDPEDALDGMRERLRRAEERVEGEGGSVAQREGHGLLAFFGHPRAWEDAPDRALRAALALAGDSEVPVRIGIDTGDVILHPGSDTPAFGDAPQRALHLREQADADASIRMSERTQRLARGRFATRPLPTGAEGAAFAVDGILPGRARAQDATAFSPWVGREQELGLLAERFEATCEERGQVVLVTGEPGIGKSRLLREFRERIEGRPHRWVEGFATPEAQGSPLFPAIALLERTFRDGSPKERMRDVAETLARLGDGLEEAVPLVAELLSLPDDTRFPSAQLAPQRKRERTIELLVAWVLALCEDEPVVLVLEDLHWADPSTLEVLGRLNEEAATARLLVVLTARPEFRAPWPKRSHQMPLALARLSNDQAAEIARHVVGESAVAAAVAARADGNPYFAEELARIMGRGGRAGSPVPETLRDLLAARLDRLEEDREIAQLGSVLGREFEYGLIAALAPRHDAALRRGLARLVGEEVLLQRGQAPHARYRFQHALLRDAAHQSLVREERRRLHAEAARVLTAQFPDLAERHPEWVAQHLAEADQSAEAATAYLNAGERAAGRWAYAEAEQHFRAGLVSLARAPSAHPEVEIELRSQLAAALFATQGYGSRDALEGLERARQLAAEGGPSPELFRVVYGTWIITYSIGDPEPTEALGERLVTLAAELGGTRERTRASAAAAFVAFQRGDLVEAESRFEESEQLRGALDEGGDDPYRNEDLWLASWVGCNAPLFRGKFDLVERRIAAASENVEATDAPFERAFGATAEGIYRYELGQREAAASIFEESAVRTRDRGLTFESMTHGLIGAAMRAELGAGAAALAQVEEGFARWDEVGAFAFRSHVSAYASRGFAASGALDRAEELAEHGIELATTHLDAYYLPELRRLRGALWLRRDRNGRRAEAEFRTSLQMAEERGALLFQLRTATQLARLLFDEGRRAEAREILEAAAAAFPSDRGADWETAQALRRELR